MAVNQDIQELVFRYDASALTRADADVRQVTEAIAGLVAKLAGLSAGSGGAAPLASLGNSAEAAAMDVQELQVSSLSLADTIEKVELASSAAAGKTYALAESYDASARASVRAEEATESATREVYDLVGSMDHLSRTVQEEARDFANAFELMETKAIVTSEAVETVGAKMVPFRSSAKDATRATIELTRGFQDFAAAGLYGIANNVEGITLALQGLFANGIRAGLSTLAAGMLGPAGLIAGFTAITVLGPAVVDKIREFLDSLDPDPVKAMTEAIKGIEEQNKNTTLSFDELIAKSKLAFAPDSEQESGRRIGEFLRNTGAAREAQAQMVQEETQRQIQADPRFAPIREQLAGLKADLAEAEASVARQPRNAVGDAMRAEITENVIKPLVEDINRVISNDKFREIQADAQKQAMATVNRRLAAPAAVEQEALAAQFEGMGMGDAARGIRERGVDAVRRERAQEALTEGLEKIRQGFERAVREGAQGVGRRREAQERLAADREKALQGEGQLTPQEEWEFAQPEVTGKQAAAGQRRARANNRRQQVRGQKLDANAQRDAQRAQADRVADLYDEVAAARIARGANPAQVQRDLTVEMNRAGVGSEVASEAVERVLTRAVQQAGEARQKAAQSTQGNMAMMLRLLEQDRRQAELEAQQNLILRQEIQRMRAQFAQSQRAAQPFFGAGGF